MSLLPFVSNPAFTSAQIIGDSLLGNEEELHLTSPSVEPRLPRRDNLIIQVFSEICSE
ncbi:hypothetical protein SK128_010575 [Halocaridina rubra]|uniref:Uncharacterized protein n=1 Tax=Halocaridina rubra TaxID=373956 RepID=A0AAN8XEK5_HALRR